MSGRSLLEVADELLSRKAESSCDDDDYDEYDQARNLALERAQILLNTAILILWDYEGEYTFDYLRGILGVQRGRFVPEREPESKRKSITPRQRKRIMERDAYRCQRCDGYIDLHIDHVYPVILGGTDDDENLQVLCAHCNLFKGARI